MGTFPTHPSEAFARIQRFGRESNSKKTLDYIPIPVAYNAFVRVMNSIIELPDDK